MSVSEKPVGRCFFLCVCVYVCTHSDFLDCISMGFMKFGIRTVKELFEKEDVDKEVKHNPLLKVFPTSKVSSSFQS